MMSAHPTHDSHDWSAVRDETVKHLQRLIQFQTVNPPGNELEIAQYLKAVLEREEISVALLEPAPSRAAVLATIKGTGEKAPIMLVAHTDVVSVEEEQWHYPPFGGEVHDGYLYGRGAIDDKGMLAVHLTVMCLLARYMRTTNTRLSRDVILLAPPDEETGGKQGMGWLAQHHAEKLNAEYALNEGGRVRINADGSRTLLLQVAEKVSHVVTISAAGTAGHAGVPRADNAILRLGRAIAKIATYASDPQHGVSPTILRAGSKFNVLPSEASLILNIRTRPNESIDDILGHLGELIDDTSVVIELTERGAGAPASPEDSEMYKAIASAAQCLDSTITVTPYLSNGVTDSAVLRRLGVKAYGLLPFPLTQEDEGRMHGHDERVSLESLDFGTRLVWDTVVQLTMA